jgi:cell division protein ZapA (FtsZ GTPase activity inhibitor)
MGDDKLSIKINLADRYYPLKIETHDEERIRRAAKLINEKILQYKQRYVDKDNQDFLAMAALQFVIKYLEEEEKTQQAPVRESLEDLNDELEAFLNTKQ